MNRFGLFLLTAVAVALGGIVGVGAQDSAYDCAPSDQVCTNESDIDRLQTQVGKLERALERAETRIAALESHDHEHDHDPAPETIELSGIGPAHLHRPWIAAAVYDVTFDVPDARRGEQMQVTISTAAAWRQAKGTIIVINPPATNRQTVHSSIHVHDTPPRLWPSDEVWDFGHGPLSVLVQGVPDGVAWTLTLTPRAE